MNVIIAIGAVAKTFAIIGIVLAGIFAAFVRGLMDMTSNWETGFGPDSKRAQRQALALLVAGIVAAILFGLFA